MDHENVSMFTTEQKSDRDSHYVMLLHLIHLFYSTIFNIYFMTASTNWVAN